jgi:ATP adenylyltransferase
MDIDRLWAPWRIKYVQAIPRKKTKAGCIFCKPVDHVVFTTRLSECMLNIFPYNNGHLMVAPRRHCGDLSALSEREQLDLLRSVNRAKKLLEKVLAPDGFNIGINISRTAGAGIPGHIHVHIVPRWNGDTNFMPVTAGTKVLSQSLDELLTQLHHAQKP